MVWMRAVVRVQLRVCTETMASVYLFTAARCRSWSPRSSKGVGCTVARLKESKGVVEVDVGEVNGVVLFAAQTRCSHTL